MIIISSSSSSSNISNTNSIVQCTSTHSNTQYTDTNSNTQYTNTNSNTNSIVIGRPRGPAASEGPFSDLTIGCCFCFRISMINCRYSRTQNKKLLSELTFGTDWL